MPRPYSHVSDFLFTGKDPSITALTFTNDSCTYGHLHYCSNQVARYVLRMGGRPGDRVLLISENTLFWVAAYLGIIRAGMVCVPLAPSTSPTDIRHILNSTEAKIAFVQIAFGVRNAVLFEGLHVITDRPATALPGTSSQDSFAALQKCPSPSSSNWPTIYADDLAAIMFTSGSTGTPRGVMVSHDNICSNTESIIEVLQLTAADRIMTVLPFHYCFGTSLLHTHLRVGGSLVVDPRFMYPETVIQNIIDSRCTGFAGVPSHFQILLRASSLRNRSFPSLRYVQQAGGLLASSFIRELREALPHTAVFVMYGQTEGTARLSYLPPHLLESKCGSIGRGLPGVTLRVLNESGSEVAVGEVGEIVAAGRNVARGYWRDLTESETTFRNGTLHTGDLAKIDEDGFIYIVDRAKNFLKCGGERISCTRIEEQLLLCADLLEVAVIGIPDDTLGEAVKAFAVPRISDHSAFREHFATFCRGRIPTKLIPRQLVVLPSLPKNSSGKVLKQLLRTL